MLIKNLTAVNAGYAARTETFNGRAHLAVPVVALVDGAVKAMNAATYERVTAAEFGKNVQGWDGRPLFVNHPTIDGDPVSGGDPRILEKSIGTIFKSALKDQKLTMEAWIDIERCEKIDPRMLARVRAGHPVEISVGAFVETDATEGIVGDRKYRGAWTKITPDHLALLDESGEGACSVAMGCGIRTAAAQYTHVTEENHMKQHAYDPWLEQGDETLAMLRTLRNIPQSERDGLPKGDFAGPNDSFPIAQAVDVHDAALALGRAKGDRSSIKRKIVAIAYRKGGDFVAQLPADWQRTSDQKNASAFARLMDAARAMFRTAQNADEMTAHDLKGKLYDALMAVEPNCSGVETYFPVTDPAHVVYSVWIPSNATGVEMGMGYQTELYERSFTLSDTGVVTLADARVEVQPVMSYEPVEGASPELKTAIGNGNNQYTHANAAAEKAVAAAKATTGLKGEASNNMSSKAAVAHQDAANAHRAMAASTKGAARTAHLDAAMAHLDAIDYHNGLGTKADAIKASKDAMVATMKTPDPKLKNAATGAPGSAQDTDALDINHKGDSSMKKEDVIKALETATECQLKALAAILDPVEAAKLKAAADKEAADKKAADEKAEVDKVEEAKLKGASTMKTPTFAEMLAAADVDTRELIQSGLRAAAATKDASIKVLTETKRCGITVEELKKKSQTELDQLVTLSGATVKAAGVDYSGQGAPNTGAANDVPAPADLGAAIRAARAKK